MKPPYDTFEGISSYLTGIEGFSKLLSERMEAGYSRKERLLWWTILGRYVLDPCGNCWVLETLLEDSPLVSPEFGKGKMVLSWVANDKMKCVRCGKKWEMENAHDIHLQSRESPFHKECYKWKVAEDTRDEMEEITKNAGLSSTILLAIPNQYNKDYHCGPWFTFIHETLGRVSLGWRTSVISIQWEKGPDGNILFQNEGVTKGPQMVHAWGAEKATQYLKMLVEEGAP